MTNPAWTFGDLATAPCGGSRARAWSRGDVFGDDPLCGWIPQAGAEAVA